MHKNRNKRDRNAALRNLLIFKIDLLLKMNLEGFSYNLQQTELKSAI